MLDIRTNENETKKYFAEKEAYEKYYKDKPFYRIPAAIPLALAMGM